MIAQQQGAKAIIATLWQVADDSTGLLMAKFYAFHRSRPGISKAEALRQAQLALLRGEEESSSRSNKVLNQTAPYAHPYFWSPFILIGNSK